MTTAEHHRAASKHHPWRKLEAAQGGERLEALFKGVHFPLWRFGAILFGPKRAVGN